MKPGQNTMPPAIRAQGNTQPSAASSPANRDADHSFAGTFSPWEDLVRLLQEEKNFDASFAAKASDLMAGRAKTITAPPQATLLRGGESLSSVHLLLCGRIYILRYTHDGRRVIPDLLDAPQILGLAEALHDEKTYKATVATLKDCTLLKISKEELLSAAEKSSFLSRYLMGYLAALAGNLMENSGHKMAASGMENLLLYLHHQTLGKDLPGEISDTKTFLADLLNINKRTLYRYLKDLEEEKIIRRVGQSIILGEDNRKKLMDKIHHLHLLE